MGAADEMTFEVAAVVSEEFGEQWKALKNRWGRPVRSLAIVLCRRHIGFKSQQIGEHCGESGIDSAAVSGTSPGSGSCSSHETYRQTHHKCPLLILLKKTAVFDFAEFKDIVIYTLRNRGTLNVVGLNKQCCFCGSNLTANNYWGFFSRIIVETRPLGALTLLPSPLIAPFHVRRIVLSRFLIVAGYFLLVGISAYPQVVGFTSTPYHEPVYTYSGTCYMLRESLACLKNPAGYPPSSYSESNKIIRRALYSLEFFTEHLSEADLDQKYVPFITQPWVNKESSRKLINDARSFFKEANIPLPKPGEFPIPTFPACE